MARWVEFYNNLTRTADKHLRFTVAGDFSPRSYILDDGLEQQGDTARYLLRFPGATRAGILADDKGTITKILLDDKTCFGEYTGCYKESLRDALTSLIGTNIRDGYQLKNIL